MSSYRTRFDYINVKRFVTLLRVNSLSLNFVKNLIKQIFTPIDLSLFTSKKINLNAVPIWTLSPTNLIPIISCTCLHNKSQSERKSQNTSRFVIESTDTQNLLNNTRESRDNKIPRSLQETWNWMSQ